MIDDNKRLPRYIHTGNSMYPTLHDMDIAIPVSCEFKDIRPGDVIVFRDGGRSINVAHRVVAKNQDHVKTRGDNNHADDTNPIYAGDIVGRVDMALRHDRLIRIYGSKAGLIIGVACRARLSMKRIKVKALRLLQRLSGGLIP